jgi:hypothetical protein
MLACVSGMLDCNQPPVGIVGFGACMIDGYPHDRGMFAIACEFIEKNLSLSVQSGVVGLGGFPVPRAEKYFKKRVLVVNPDYVVVQFGSTDASCPIRTRRKSIQNASRSSDSTVFLPPTWLTMVRWQLQSLAGLLRRPEPVTSRSRYVGAIENIAEECVSAGITPVVLSPFVFGSRYSTRNAAGYTDALHDLHAKVNRMILVDCIRLLCRFPRLKILQRDGFHLSRFGHDLIEEAIGRAIVADVKQKNRLMAAPLAATAHE